ncbi:Integrin alpha-11 [Willisornis vidua]|uniref:Integrin alpha-11 n=1 Tax=Willisornis vidua TaxID=1566151 RepID=A0ABQ9DDH3_9PASS|nr:Integrin alpha-11 [Willisornis vidua]
MLLACSLCLLPGLGDTFNIDTKRPKIISGSKEAYFGYTVQQHDIGGNKWLVVGAPYETNGQQKTGDVYKCPVTSDSHSNCTKLNLGRVTLSNVSERKDNMRLGLSLATNPRDSSFLACSPLWSHECGSSYYTTGMCSRVNSNFRFSRTVAPALQRCQTYMDIIIVLDGSNSIYPWVEVQHFLINILKKFYIGPGQIQVGVVQYGEDVVHEFHLNDYRSVKDVVAAASHIEQRGGTETRTAYGIEFARRGINPEAFLNEIKFIASDPDEKHFFNVTDEAALKDIVDALGERIFSLEGTNKNEISFGLEMSQTGFSSHVVEDGILLGAVGAYDWNGAVLKETSSGKVIPLRESYLQEFPEELKNHGAYLGYTVSSVISTKHERIYVAGAPRFNHTGKVILFSMHSNRNLTIHQALKGEQIGSYYGSEINSLDVNGDGVTDVLLVGAPMYFSEGRERGKVYVYTLQEQNIFSASGALGDLQSYQNSRFGSCIAAVPDLNQDGYNDLVVGAPLEDEHQGAIYIFLGFQETILKKYKQRIAAADLAPGLMYFGCSIHGQLDLNEDGLVDLAVGSLGNAVLLWSRSVVRINTSIRFEPPKINIFTKDCRRGGKEATCMSALVCFTAVFLSAHFQTATVADYVKPVTFSIDYELEEPQHGPMLDDGWPTSLRVSVPFWNGCNEDEHCVPDLVLDARSDVPSAITVLNISFSRNLQLASLIPKDDTDVNMDCATDDRHPNKRVCNVSYPFFRAKAKVAFRLDFEFSKSVFLENMEIYLIASSDSEEKESTKEDNVAHLNFQLKYEADLLFTRTSSLDYYEVRSNSSLERYDSIGPPFHCTFKLQNLGFFPVEGVTIRITVPVATRAGNRLLLLTDFLLDQENTTCSIWGNTTDYGGTPAEEDLSHTPHLNHSNSDVVSIDCNVKLAPGEEMNLHLRGNLWMKSLKALKFKSLKLTMNAALQRRFGSPFVFREEDPTRQITFEISKPEESQIPIWIILGSTLGGLLLLALLVLVLWKVSSP